MTGHEREPAPNPQVAASAGNGPEAEMMCARLGAAGIPAFMQRAIGGPEWGLSGGFWVYVAPENLARARELLGTGAAPLSDADLARESEEASGGPQPPGEG